MLDKLRQKKVKPEIINTVEWLYGQTAIKVGEKICPILKGIIQGSVASPLMFLCAFDDIFEELEQIGVDLFGYADDLSIVGEDFT